MIMKKMFVFLAVAIFAITALAFAAEDVKQELRPSQKLMQARATALKGMNQNLGTSNFKAIVKNANKLSAETKKTGNKVANPLAKEITLAISVLAQEASAASAKKDADTVKTKLGEIKGRCDECHAKIRDKK
jgi:hypothetical protein